ncbi:uncharacterized protein LOC141912475 [Tubulanus polymorphus]|uniref:uncharacterized protein LOC141912475 n=1 Tax=Tubulanus polymorphus TaxID=672921 RepID=UPI003DA5A87A
MSIIAISYSAVLLLIFGIFLASEIRQVSANDDDTAAGIDEEDHTYSYVNKDCPAPGPCVCIGRQIDCSHKNLSEIPVFDTSVRLLTTSTQYVELRLDHNEIQEINEAAFIGLDLEQLYLSYNKISRINERAFEGLNNLKWLDIAENRVSSLAADMLHNLTNLEDLVLSGNYLRSLNESFFIRLDRLRVLMLMDNELETFPTGIKYLPILSHLYLQRNNIDYVPDYAFTNLKNLVLINLSKMRTNLTLSPRAFCGHQQRPEISSAQNDDTDDAKPSAKGISFVDLSDSGIRSLDICQLAFVSSITELDLEGNPIECDCDLFFFRHMKRNVKNVQCVKPDKYKHKTLLSLEAADGTGCVWDSDSLFAKCSEICDVAPAASIQIIRTNAKKEQFLKNSGSRSSRLEIANISVLSAIFLSKL